MAKINLGRIQSIAHRRSEESGHGSSARDRFSLEQSQIRAENIARWYSEGGQYFANWSEQHYRRPPDGTPIAWTEPYLKPFYLCFGNPWIEYLVCQKPAQVYFSETLVNMAAFVLASLRSPLGFGFEREAKLRDMVGPRIQTAFDYIEVIRAIKHRRQQLTGRSDTDLKSRVLTVGGVTATFFYASTSRKAGGSERQASSSISSWTGWVMLADEIELWPEGVLDVAKSRQLSFSPPVYLTKPFRAGSTPGHEGGVTDREVKNADHYFQWRVTCPHCHTPQILDVFGNFLRPQETSEGDRYLTGSGRPLSWWCHDDSNSLKRQQSVYVGCRHCGGDLDWDTRANGEYWCSYTNQAMLPLLDRLCTDRTLIRRAAIEITPLSSSRFVPDRVLLELLTTRNPSDTIQQTLGKAVSIGSGKIQLPTIQAAIARETPVSEADTLTVIGVDQGREGHWCVVTRWHLPTAKDLELSWRSAFVEVIEHGLVFGFEGLDELRRHYKADLVGLDNEPEINLASDYARQNSADLQPVKAEPYRPQPDGSYLVRRTNPAISADRLDFWTVTKGWRFVEGDALGDRLVPVRGFDQPIAQIGRYLGVMGVVFVDAVVAKHSRRVIYLFDQVYLRGQTFRYSTRNVQGNDVLVWAIDRTFGLDAVRDRFSSGLIALPDGLVYNPSDNANLVLHLLTSDRATDGRWVTGDGQPDHYLHALSFAEMAVLCSGHEPKRSSGFAVRSLG